MELTEQLQLDRKLWLHELRDGEHRQIRTYLAMRMYGQWNYCALGVGGVAVGIGSERLDRDIIEEHIGTIYELSAEVVGHITRMNDRYADEFEKRPQRSFEFIARWLEIYFTLEAQRNGTN